MTEKERALRETLSSLGSVIVAYSGGADSAYLAWVANDTLGSRAVAIRAAGGSYMTGRHESNPNVFYEVKYKTPEGIVFDVTANGWRGAVKNVEPAKAKG